MKPRAAFGPAPRLLTEQQAATYLCVPVAEFRRQGIGRVQIGLRIRYDRVALDDWLDAARGVVASEPPKGDADEALARFASRFEATARRA